MSRTGIVIAFGWGAQTTQHMSRRSPTLRLQQTAPQSARRAKLRYATDRRPGIARRRSGKGFRYVTPAGRPVVDQAVLARIRALAVPPAWTDVWISPDSQSHLQATGRDARGRKQYRYHAKWREVRHHTKFERMVPFAQALPRMRARVESDVRQSPLTKEKVVATIVQLLERTLIRVGNEEYARANRSFGLTTLRDRHVRIRGGRVQFTFVGKSGIRQSIALTDARLARIVKRCQDLPGQELFQYLADDGRRRSVTSADVNAYLRDVAGQDFTAKDFRTWAGTLRAAMALRKKEAPGSQRGAKRTITMAIEQVAGHLGNTPAVCRACYIHPTVLETYADGTLTERLTRRKRRVRGLSSDECAVLALLQTPRDFRTQLAEAARAARVARAA